MPKGYPNKLKKKTKTPLKISGIDEQEKGLERRYEIANRLEQALNKLEDAREHRDIERTRRLETETKFTKAITILRRFSDWGQSNPVPDPTLGQIIHDVRGFVQEIGPAVQ